MVEPLLTPENLPAPPPNWDNYDVLTDHPELHHYTTLQGLRGIVSTNSLWATHYKDLNDATELTLIRKPLEAELSKGFAELIRAQRVKSLKAERAVKSMGGLRKAAEKSAQRLIALLYASTFTIEDGLTGIPELRAPAFISSFCTHSSEDDAYERENGLLSQWRGYGGRGGYCIVFDTRKLFDLLSEEYAYHSYMSMAIDPVRYLYPEVPISSVFPKLRNVLDHMMKYSLDTRIGEPDDIFTDFIKSAIYCKHHAFHEEREVRIAVRPATDGWRDAIAKDGRWRVPQAKVVIGEEGQRRRVVLFEALGKALPIKRIIVGPSSNQKDSVMRLRGIVGDDFDIRVSETPYLAREWS